MPAVIARSCNKLLIRKIYWKSAALPYILYGTEDIFLSQKYITDIHIEENNALRYTDISALRGEIGSALQTSRDMETTNVYIKHILQHKPNEIIILTLI